MGMHTLSSEIPSNLADPNFQSWIDGLDGQLGYADAAGAHGIHENFETSL